MNEVFGIGGRNAGEENAVDHTGVTGVEQAEGGAVAGLCGADEGVVGGGRAVGRGHREETWAGRAEFEECGHARCMRLKTLLLDRRGGRGEC